MKAASLVVEGVTKRFGGIVAVDGVSFSVEPGETFGVMGPNGAGKTTLLNCINGLTYSDHGRVLLDDQPIMNRPAHRVAAAGVARTFQLAEHFRTFRAVEFVMLGRLRWQVRSLVRCALMLPGVRRSEKAERLRATEMLSRFGLEHIAETNLKDLPYGVQKRVDIARALAAEPRLLLLDEPTSGVSPEERADIVHAVATAKAMGVTQLLVDHNVGFITQTCSRALVMNYGLRIALGTPREVLSAIHVREAYLGI
jgi:branched-chain amino acid transport system ATP-binding protein